MMVPERMHKFQIDWHLNVANILTIILALIGGIGAWYNLKQEVYANHQQAELKFIQVEKFMAEQKKMDDVQDNQRERLATEMKETIRESNRDIKQEIRDLRTDLRLKK